MRQDSESLSKPAVQSILWRYIALAFIFSVTGTAVLGGVLFLLQQNVWLIALGGLLSLFAAGAWLGWQAKDPEPLYGALLAVLYFGLVVGILFGGELTEALPDPLPGLAIGDSTFFFVSPLFMLVAAVFGTVLGGRLSARWRMGMEEGAPGGKGV